MLLQLIISQYKNGDAQIKRLLDSINIQQNIDFSEIEAIIVNDGDFVVLSEEFQNSFTNYNFNIRYVFKDWGGISSVRQYGQDLAEAEYIMFCDGDDLFLRTNSLWEYFYYMYQDDYDIITAKFATDLQDNTISGWHYRDYNLENVWIHGKIFRLSFLKEHNIKWHNELQIYEDSYYVRLCFAMSPRKVNIENATYYWKFTPGSWTRSDPHWTTNTYSEKVLSNQALVDELIIRNNLADAGNYVWAQIYEMYFTLHTPEAYDPHFYEQYEKIKRTYVDYYKKYSQYLQYISEEAEIVMIEVMFRRFYTEMNRPAEVPVYNEKIDYKAYNRIIKEKMYEYVDRLLTLY